MKKLSISAIFLAMFIIFINNQAKAQTRATITIGINAPTVRIYGVRIIVRRPASAVLLKVDLTQGIISDWSYIAYDFSGYGISADLISAGSVGSPSSWPYANGTLFKLEYDITDVPVQEKSDFALDEAFASGMRDNVYVDLDDEYFSFQLSPINKTPVISSFTADPASGYPPLPVTFSCSAYDPDGDIAEYKWDFDGNGNSDETTIADTTTYTYQNAGTYYARVTVVDNEGATATSDPITINVSQFTTISLDIKVNESDGPITLSQSDTLSITVALNNNSQTDNADWWLAADTPFGLYFYTFAGWINDWVPAYQGPLFYLDSYEVFSTSVSGFPEGNYTFYFGVDTNMDGDVTWDSLYCDTVEVSVTEHAPDFSGTWTGSWDSTWSPASGSVSATVSQVGNNLSTNVTVTNTAFGTITANLSGTANGSTFDLSGRWSGGGYSGRLDYINGTLSGNTITGNYVFYVDGWGLNDYGTFILER